MKLENKEEPTIEIVKSTGDKSSFSLSKLRNSLKRCGADQKTISRILDKVRDELYLGISTKEIYDRAYAMLQLKKPVYASKYKLKKAIYELGPTGFPFERFIGFLLQYSGYDVSVGQILQGKCVQHEVDVVAKKGNQHILAECKFHSEGDRNCNVKVPLYIRSRYQDILDYTKKRKTEVPNECWVVTNTRFTSDALQYGVCSGMYLLSWDYPKNDSLKDRIDRLGLYPITVSTILTDAEKEALLKKNIVLCRQLLEESHQLDLLEISNERKTKIIDELKILSKIN